MTDPTLPQQRAIAYSPKPFAAISMFASIYVLRHLFKHPEKRKRLYHRLVGAMNVCFIIRSLSMLWGNWAVPEGTPNFVGAVGTVETCTAQGFFSTMSVISVPGYYASLSVCSYMSIKHRFNENHYKWIEKWIHSLCIVLPVSFSSWMAVTENINPYGAACIISRSPVGCDVDPNVPCERGSESHGLATYIFGLGQIFIYFVIPPSAMLGVFILMKKAEKDYEVSQGMKHIIEAARKRLLCDMLVQISLYLFSFWSTYVLTVVEYILQMITGEISYNLLIVANAVNLSQGVVLMLVYFQLQKHSKSRQTENELPNGPKALGGKNLNDVETIRVNASLKTTTERRKSSIKTTSFSIFDGTPDASSPWAKYIEEAEEELEQEEDLGCEMQS